MTIEPKQSLVLNEASILSSGTFLFQEGLGMMVKKDEVVIDGNNTIIEGPGSYDKGLRSFKGTGLTLENIKKVTIKNITIKGFRLGIYIHNCEEVIVENTDCSDNFTDPEFGWGDGEPFGAVMLENSNCCIIRNNKGNNVWNGLFLKNSHDNQVIDNDYSKCSNVGIYLYQSCRNNIENNNFSWGLRIKEGEVHARDSSSHLMEHGSNDNTFINNDFTHGGDGIFIRSLDDVISTGNYFEGNDCSYANNNAVECWSPGNTFVKNIANYSSYGFWMGGSNNTLMLENEIAYNGTNFSNAPEKDFGHAGLAVVHGSSNHFKLIRNNIHDNNGQGIALGYTKDKPAYHWLVQGNTIKDNAKSAIYMRDTKWVHIEDNIMEGNKEENIFYDKNVRDIFLKTVRESCEAPCANFECSDTIIALGEEIVFDASSSEDPNGKELTYRWEFGDGTLAEEKIVRHRFTKEGMYHIALTVNNGTLSDVVGSRVYVYVHDEWKE